MNIKYVKNYICICIFFLFVLEYSLSCTKLTDHKNYGFIKLQKEIMDGGKISAIEMLRR